MDPARPSHARALLVRFASSPWLDVLLVTAVAAAVRFSGLDTAPWDHNQAEILKLVDPIVEKGEWPALGWEISGRFGGALPTLLFWILALPRFVTLSPTVLVGFGAAFDVAAAALTCVIARKLFGRTAGLVAGLLYALDAALVAHAQILWNVTMLPLFTALLLLGLVVVLVEGRSWGVVLVLVALSMAVQIHFLTAYLLPPVVLLAGVFRPRLRPAHVVVGLVLALVTWWPYLDHEARYGYPNLRAAREIVGAVFGGTPVPAVDVVPAHFNDAVLWRGATFRGVEFPYLPTRFLPDELAPARFVRIFAGANAVRAALAGLGAAAMVWVLLRGRAGGGTTDPEDELRARRARAAAVLLASYALPIGMLALVRFRIYDRYLLPLYPLPVLLAVAWIPVIGARWRKLATVLGAAGLAAWCASQWTVVNETRAEARATGLVAADGTLGAKLDIARLFLEEIGLDAAAFTRDTTFFSWPGGPAPDRHRGFRPLFAYLVDEAGVERRVDKPRGPRYLIVYRGEQVQVVPELIASEEYERELFSVVRADEAVSLGYARRRSDAPADWVTSGGPTDGWTIANFPLSWGGETAIPETVEAQYLEVPIQLRAPREHGLFVLQTRECVASVSLDGEVLATDPCPPGRARDERESLVHAYRLDGRWHPGENVLRIKLVVRYSTASVDAYVLSLKNPDRLMTPPPEVVRYARFASPDPRRYRIPLDPPPRGWVPIGLPVSSDTALDVVFSAGPDTPATIRFDKPMWAMPTWDVKFSFLSPRAYWLTIVSPFPRPDFRGYWGIGMALESSGAGSALRLVLRDTDGDEWRYQDQVVMWEEGWKALAIPFDAFEQDMNQSLGNRKLDLEVMDAVMVQVVPGKVTPPLRDQEVRFTPPVLLRHEP
ncbi:MAG: hypothetical protein IPK07_14835 [Deltaproteobacteria bacterium]|nr:hypothetical protein [Deltaproteobacteria bacterium]